ncbi:MAG: hypothetical protein HYV07_17295 [Deltaproteobacteria bacterium]|nr:hypothetical protein [Deltaproteobacteria bacterium]
MTTKLRSDAKLTKARGAKVGAKRARAPKERRASDTGVVSESAGTVDGLVEAVDGQVDAALVRLAQEREELVRALLAVISDQLEGAVGRQLVREREELVRAFAAVISARDAGLVARLDAMSASLGQLWPRLESVGGLAEATELPTPATDMADGIEALSHEVAALEDLLR